jgi:hypothetical protein
MNRICDGEFAWLKFNAIPLDGAANNSLVHIDCNGNVKQRIIP